MPTISQALVVEIPSGLKTKGTLLNELYQRLKFPDYFGDNWDALEECIRDLSWLSNGSIILRHHDLPLVNDTAGQKIYLSILKDVLEKKKAVPGQSFPELIVVFPLETQEMIMQLLELAD